MKETINAFFYQNEYYLFPEGVDDVETLRSMGEVKVLRLKKDRCLPPDFKYEETEETVICVSAPAYPVASVARGFQATKPIWTGITPSFRKTAFAI